MVTVIGYNSRKNKSGENFITLELTVSLEIVQSQSTGKMYATVKKCSIPSTFDEQIAKMMIGSKIEGEIVRVPCDPYDYTVKSTGEQITLAYSYAYQPAGSKELVGHGFVELDNQRESGKPAQGNGANTGDAARLLASSK